MDREEAIKALIRSLRQGKAAGCPFHVWFAMCGLPPHWRAHIEVVWPDIYPCGPVAADSNMTRKRMSDSMKEWVRQKARIERMTVRAESR